MCCCMTALQVWEDQKKRMTENWENQTFEILMKFKLKMFHMSPKFLEDFHVLFTEVHIKSPSFVIARSPGQLAGNFLKTSLGSRKCSLRHEPCSDAL